MTPSVSVSLANQVGLSIRSGVSLYRWKTGVWIHFPLFTGKARVLKMEDIVNCLNLGYHFELKK